MTLRHIYPILAFLLLLASAGAAKAVDLTAMEVDVQMHPSHYRELIERFEKGDTTLTSDQLQKVYFGYSFTPDYDPREIFPEAEAAYEAADYPLALALAEEALKANPVSLDLTVVALASAERMRDRGDMGPRILLYGTRADMIATAILESGSGTQAHSPFCVIASADMTRLLRNVLSIDSIVDRTKVGDVDAIKVTFPASDRRHILYFDTTREMRFFKSHPVDPSL